MPTIPVKTAAGVESGSAALDDHWFAIAPNVPVMHQVVVAQLAAARAGTQSTKTRAEVAISGRKQRRQKGGGTSRQGSSRAPQWVGGGVALGPKPRKYAQRTPKKMINLALRSALSDRANEGRVVVIKDWGVTTPKTKDAVAALKALGIGADKVLVVLDGRNAADQAAGKSFHNLPYVQVLDAGQLNTYDVLTNDWIVFTEATVPGDRQQEASQ